MYTILGLAMDWVVLGAAFSGAMPDGHRIPDPPWILVCCRYASLISVLLCCSFSTTVAHCCCAGDAPLRRVAVILPGYAWDFRVRAAHAGDNSYMRYSLRRAPLPHCIPVRLDHLPHMLYICCLFELALHRVHFSLPRSRRRY